MNGGYALFERAVNEFERAGLMRMSLRELRMSLRELRMSLRELRMSLRELVSHVPDLVLAYSLLL